MEALKDMADNQYDLAIVDPPYNNNDAIGIKNGKTNLQKRSNYKLFENKKPSDIYFDELKRVSRNQIIWGGNFFGIAGGYICWNKFGTAFGDAELAYCSMINCVRVFEYVWNGMLQGKSITAGRTPIGDKTLNEKRIHPTQKPVQLYKWLLKNYAKENDNILDTHGGSMSIALACHDMKFDLDLYEIDKDYFEAGSKRYNNHIRQLQLF